MKADGAHYDVLVSDLKSGLDMLTLPVRQDPELWHRGRPGKWTAGQHVEHVALTLAATASAFEHAAEAMRRNLLGRPSRRGPLQALWVALVAGAEKMPRGVRTGRAFEATSEPDPAATLERLEREAERHYALGERLSATERDRLWAPNPFLTRWHYTLPEILRVHAVHARHHARLILQIEAVSPSRRERV